MLLERHLLPHVHLVIRECGHHQLVPQMSQLVSRVMLGCMLDLQLQLVLVVMRAHGQMLLELRWHRNVSCVMQERGQAF